jgi:phosphoribosylglycinamide formyltransferase-1
MIISMKRIVVLFSGRGSNLQSIARACVAERWSARIAGVITDRPEAPGCDVARGLGLTVEAIDRKAFPDRGAFDDALGRSISAFDPHAVVLAGFMRVLGAPLVDAFAGRMLNIHPSLLPAFPGMATHRRALEAGVRVHGATVHYVNAGVDTGPIIAQAAVPVHDDDSEDSLAARVLAVEHRLYPMALRWHLEGRLRIDGSRVRIDEHARKEMSAWPG